MHPPTGKVHLTYHRDDKGVSFVMPIDERMIYASDGGYNEPVTHTTPLGTDSLYLSVVVQTFLNKCNNLAEGW